MNAYETLSTRDLTKLNPATLSSRLNYLLAIYGKQIFESEQLYVFVYIIGHYKDTQSMSQLPEVEIYS